MTSIFKSIRRLDEVTFYWLFRFTRMWRDSRLAIWVSHSGNGPYYAVLAGGMVIATVEGSMVFLQRTLIAFAIELPLYWWLKNTLRRARPALERLSFEPVITPADRFSFPSGHATAAFLFAGLASVSFPPWAMVFYIWASLVALSRVALGVHFPSDILAGAVLGSGIAYFILQLPIA